VAPLGDDVVRDFIKHNVYIILGVVLIFVIGGLFIFNGLRASSRGGEPAGSVQSPSIDAEPYVPHVTDTTTPLYVIVDVVGAVYNPGVFTLPADARVIHAIEAAGGYTAYAFRPGINGATELVDAMQIYVPTLREDGSHTSAPVASIGGGIASGGGIQDDRLCLNTATYAQLRTLTHIGTVRAQNILNHRELLGGFSSVEQLLEITGIGDGILDDIRPYITVR